MERMERIREIVRHMTERMERGEMDGAEVGRWWVTAMEMTAVKVTRR